jgi:uncharacterized protein (DUF1501 family)
MALPGPDASRRQLLQWGLAGGLLACGPAGLSWAAPPSGAKQEARLVFVLLRGGMDGLYAVPALGDPDFRSARGPLAQYASEPLRLNEMFSLHPAMSHVHAMYQRKEALVVHAVGLPFSGRSHFDAQQMLESGGSKPYELDTGWLGRAIGPSSATRAMALNTVVPLMMRGAREVDTWAPSALPEPNAELVARLERLYQNDPALATALARAKALHLDADMGGAAQGMGAAARNGGFVPLARKAAEFMATAGGPQLVMLELGGWDSHAGAANPNGPLSRNLQQLDAGLEALRQGLTPSGLWQKTVVLVASEFGREVAVNGTLGTDHGTGGVAFALGGGVSGGRVHADWPGLSMRQRFEGRDLRSTTDLRSLFSAALTEHLGLSRSRVGQDLLPGAPGQASLSLRS